MVAPVVMLGQRGDAEIAWVGEHLERLAAPWIQLETYPFFPAATLALPADGPPRLAGLDGPPRAAYLRQLVPSPVIVAEDQQQAMADNWYATLMAFAERTTFHHSLYCWWARSGVPVVNPPAAIGGSRKPLQHAVLRGAGCRVPQTLVTSDPAALRAFLDGRERVIYKPLSGGARAREVRAADLEGERAAALESAPVLFQEFVPGRNVRVYLLDGRLLGAAEIGADALDYRGAETHLARIELPQAVHERCVAAAAACGLVFTGIDLRNDGEDWVFLECNGSPMFAALDQALDLGVGEGLARHLKGESR